MKQIVMNYIIGLLISKDKSYNEIEKELLGFFLNIKRISYRNFDNNRHYSLFNNYIDKDSYNEDYELIIQKLYRDRFKESFSIDEELNILCEDISDRIIYNENMTIFTKYI